MNDTISRQAAIRWVKAECNPYGKPTLDFESGKRVIEHLKCMPSAQPERKKGHWIDREHCQVDEDGYDIGICSVCGEEITIDPLNDNFCPNCGADLKTKETDYDYERAVEQLEHDILYEPTFNQDDGSM